MPPKRIYKYATDLDSELHLGVHVVLAPYFQNWIWALMSQTTVWVPPAPFRCFRQVRIFTEIQHASQNEVWDHVIYSMSLKQLLF